MKIEWRIGYEGKIKIIEKILHRSYHKILFNNTHKSLIPKYSILIVSAYNFSDITLL